jgi:CHAT domain-containing protein
VLSGCSSAQGEILPGTGLMGLTRAWLAAGAGTVIASRWPTADESGELFLSFYRRLLGSGAFRTPARPAAALQQAQREMLHSGSWRSAPRYWAAFFATGWE